MWTRTGPIPVQIDATDGQRNAKGAVRGVEKRDRKAGSSRCAVSTRVTVKGNMPNSCLWFVLVAEWVNDAEQKANTAPKLAVRLECFHRIPTANILMQATGCLNDITRNMREGSCLMLCVSTFLHLVRPQEQRVRHEA